MQGVKKRNVYKKNCSNGKNKSNYGGQKIFL
jgi:hypothetical protein